MEDNSDRMPTDNHQPLVNETVKPLLRPRSQPLDVSNMKSSSDECDERPLPARQPTKGWASCCPGSAQLVAAVRSIAGCATSHPVEQTWVSSDTMWNALSWRPVGSTGEDEIGVDRPSAE
jgi:hypothetical protein